MSWCNRCSCNPCCCVCGSTGQQGPIGPTGPQGSVGPSGPQGSTGPPGSAQLLGIQAELLNQAGESIDHNEIIIFDNILNQVGSAFSYNIATGEFTILRNGTYLVNWWVSVDGTASTVGVVLSLNMSGGTYSRAAAPPVTGQVTGATLVSVTGGPVTLSLSNISGDSITLEDITPQASIVIIGVRT